jgi:hypothetical protein
MKEQLDGEERPALVRLEAGRRRTVAAHRFPDFRNAGEAAFRQFQLLEKLADAAIAVTPGQDALALEGLDPDCLDRRVSFPLFSGLGVR